MVQPIDYTAPGCNCAAGGMGRRSDCPVHGSAAITRKPITVDLIDQLADGIISEPTLVRWSDGDVGVMPFLINRESSDPGTVLATQEDYWIYCDGQDDPEQRASFAADIAAQEP